MPNTTAQPGPFDGLPDFKPLADNLPPQMKAALGELRKALTEPPSLGDKFPFVMPGDGKAPAVRAGRPTTTQPNQVVRLCRFVRLGDSVRAAAGKAGLKPSTAYDILSGQCAIAHHPAVTAAGVSLPAWVHGNPVGNPGRGLGAPETASAGVDASQPAATPLAPAADLPAERTA